MIVLGIDPGLAETGWAILETGKGANGCALVACGCVKTKSSVALPLRLLKVFQEFNSLIMKYNPGIICMEKQYLYTNNTTALATSQARGVILLSSAVNRKDVAEYNPKEVKIAVTGTGAAQKEQVRNMVQRILGIDKIGGTLDVSDAAAVGICHINSSSVFKAVK